MSARALASWMSWIACIAWSIGAPASAVDVGDRMPERGPVAWVGAGPDDSQPRVTLTVLFSASDPIDRAIMPRMTDLARRHPEARIVGLSADGSAVRLLCQSMGAKVGFPVGSVASVDAFMPPAGLPCAVLCDARGTVVWWGHPLDAPRPLVDALAGELRVSIPPTVLSAPRTSAPGASTGSAPLPPTGRGMTAEAPPAPWEDAPPALWEEAPTPAPMRAVIVLDPWWCWTPWPLGWHARLPLVPFIAPPGRDARGPERGGGHPRDR